MATTDIVQTILDKAKDPYLKTCRYKHCKQEFTATRLNQEYCCYDHKKKANNLKAKELRDNTKKINSILRNNRGILHDFYSTGNFNVSLNELVEKGYQYNYHTDTDKDPETKALIHWCYEYGVSQPEQHTLNFLKIWKRTLKV